MNDSTPVPEQLDRDAIRRIQSRRLQALLREIVPANPFWTERFAAAGIDVAQVKTSADLTLLPLTTKADLVADATAHPPYGSNLTFPIDNYSRMHQTSGTTGSPLRWLDTPASWDWIMGCWEQIYRIAGLRQDDRLAFPFSFGPFLGFWAGFEGAARLGYLCLPGGGMTSSARLKLIADNQATVVCCTPTYALRLAEVAEEQGFDLAAGRVRALIVAGEPGGSIPATRQRIETQWGARVFDHWGMTELGSLGIECARNPNGLHLLETECLPEIIDPRTTEPVEPGEAGELVITNLGRLGSPLIRYRTGDLVRADTAPCRCGRELLRLDGGILGRIDDMVTIRGNNVYPSTIEAILREFDRIAEFRITVNTVRSMQHLRIEIEPVPETAETAEKLAVAVSEAIRNRLNFQAEIVPVAPGSLPRFELKGRRFIRDI